MLVYHRCIARTNIDIDIDEDPCRSVMERFQLRSKRDAVNFALRSLAGEALSVERARALKGSGWEGDLDEMRAHRILAYLTGNARESHCSVKSGP
jgi:Arc/MetJ family transcription regulator